MARWVDKWTEEGKAKLGGDVIGGTVVVTAQELGITVLLSVRLFFRVVCTMSQVDVVYILVDGISAILQVTDFYTWLP